MMIELEKLVELQKVELEMSAIDSRLKKIPKEVEALEQEIATEKANLKTANDKLVASQKHRRALEGELELIEQKVSKYKDQLMQVKTNDEYRAMQKQIENAKDEASRKEDEILYEMEEADRLQTELKRHQEELNHGQARVRGMEDELEAEAVKLRQELDTRRARREELLRSVPSDLLDQYEQVARVRGGVAMAEAKDEHCQVCHVRLRPQAYNEIRLGEKILRCDSCGRILYYLGPPPGAAETTAEAGT